MNNVAIMQPTYIPWCGYFALMEYVDTFVILDSVQLEKRGWQMRNTIKTPNGAKIISIPTLTKGKRDQLISEAMVNQCELAHVINLLIRDDLVSLRGESIVLDGGYTLW